MVARSAMKSAAFRSFAFAASNPGVTLGSLVFMTAFALVTGNALLAQPGFHPDPIWTTRDDIVTKAVSPKPAVRLRKKTFLVQPVSLKDVPIPTFKSATPVSSGGSVLVREIQKELSILNLYHGEVDGIYGSNTKNAISELQSIIGLQANGLATQDLLDLLRSRDESSSDPQTTAAGSDTPTQSNLVKNIQLGLSRIGSTNIDVDGIYGSQTASAIRAFQQSQKLTVDGKPSVAVLDKLIQIGALHGT